MSLTDHQYRYWIDTVTWHFLVWHRSSPKASTTGNSTSPACIAMSTNLPAVWPSTPGRYGIYYCRGGLGMGAGALGAHGARGEHRVRAWGVRVSTVCIERVERHHSSNTPHSHLLSVKWWLFSCFSTLFTFCRCEISAPGVRLFNHCVNCSILFLNACGTTESRISFPRQYRYFSLAIPQSSHGSVPDHDYV